VVHAGRGPGAKWEMSVKQLELKGNNYAITG
jgi:hypothetical protein